MIAHKKQYEVINQAIKMGRTIGILALFLTFYKTEVFAQTDTEFWFVAPDITVGHSDSPIFIRISSGDQSASIEVTMPAADIALSKVFLSPNQTISIDLTPNIFNIETSRYNAIMRTGIKITSTTPVTAYYEVNRRNNNDIFVLKGKNALGQRFIIPAQTQYINEPNLIPSAHSMFLIVASENSTVVNITPANNGVLGHPANEPFRVKLNTGETYAVRKSISAAPGVLGGTQVDSSKPIAITICDDSVFDDPCFDLLGDQLVPVAVLGQEYVALKGSLDATEWVFVTAVEDDTKLFFEGKEEAEVTLGMGEVFQYPVEDKSIHILGSKPIYVFHTPGFGCELGMAILPSINCKGSKKIGFTRSTEEFFALNLLVRKEGIGGFSINRRTDLITAPMFEPVKGTGDRLYSAQIQLQTGVVQVGISSLITNTSNSFQMGIINGGVLSGCRYGYFSSFSTLFIGDDFSICSGGKNTLNAGTGKDSYLWSTGQITQTVEVDSPGEYWVTVETDGCQLSDTINIQVIEAHIELGEDVNICPDEQARIDGLDNFSWLWSNGSTARHLTTDQPGNYYVNAVDLNGCQASDTININLIDPPFVGLGSDIMKCSLEEVSINASTDLGIAYLWNDGLIDPKRMVITPGIYWCDVTGNGCTVRDSIEISNLPGPKQVTITGSPSVCPFTEEIVYYIPHEEGASYSWFAEGGGIKTATDTLITVDWEGTNMEASVKLVIEAKNGCYGDTLKYPVQINRVLDVEVPSGPEVICVNKANNLMYSTPATNGSIYQWEASGGEITTGQGTNEIQIDWNGVGHHSLVIKEESVTLSDLCAGISESLLVEVFKDPTDIYIEQVSVDTANNEFIKVVWGLTDKPTIKGDSIFAYKREEDASTDELLRIFFPTSSKQFVDQMINPMFFSYRYRIHLENICEEYVETKKHHSILLDGASEEERSLVILSWSPYIGWKDGVTHYQIWRKLDGDKGFVFYVELDSEETTFEAPIGVDGFNHRYVIRALEKNGNNESWSNSIEMEFENRVEIPNVFTPNGDLKNDSFAIKNAKLYEGSHLLVYNRQGKTVYQSVGYQNDWDGGNLSAGTYFYYLELNRNKRVFRGAVTILK